MTGLLMGLNVKNRRKTTTGNIIELVKEKRNLFDFMSYSEVQWEIKELRREIKRWENVIKAIHKCDPRCIWTPEINSTIEGIETNHIKGLKFTISELENTLLEKFETGAK